MKDFPPELFMIWDGKEEMLDLSLCHEMRSLTNSIELMEGLNSLPGNKDRYQVVNYYLLSEAEYHLEGEWTKKNLLD